jgi:hypothetical protein
MRSQNMKNTEDKPNYSNPQQNGLDPQSNQNNTITSRVIPKKIKISQVKKINLLNRDGAEALSPKQATEILNKSSSRGNIKVLSSANLLKTNVNQNN